MPITTSQGCTVVTGTAIQDVRLLALKGALSLQVKGIQFRYNPAGIVRRYLGSKTRNREQLLQEFILNLQQRGLII